MKTVNQFYVLTGLNGWAFLHETSGCEIDSCCSYLNFRYRACFEQALLDIQTTTECTFTLKRGCDMIEEYTVKKFLATLLCFINLQQSEASQNLHGGTTPE